MKLDNLVYEILTEAREISDDSNITPAFVEQLINVYRARYIQQEYSKRNVINPSSIQSFNLKLTPVDSSNFPGVETGTTILRSEKLPELINVAKRAAIVRIRTIDGVKGELQFMSVDRAKMTSYSRFKTLNAFLDNTNVLYVLGNAPSAILIKNITVDAVLESPKDIKEYGYGDREAGTPLDNYPLDLGMWAFVKAESLNAIFNSYKVPNDNDNNQVDDKEINSAQPTN